MLIFLSAVKLYYIFCLTSDFIFRYKYVLIKIFGNIFFLEKAPFARILHIHLKKKIILQPKQKANSSLNEHLTQILSVLFAKIFKIQGKRLPQTLRKIKYYKLAVFLFKKTISSFNEYKTIGMLKFTYS